MGDQSALPGAQDVERFGRARRAPRSHDNRVVLRSRVEGSSPHACAGVRLARLLQQLPL